VGIESRCQQTIERTNDELEGRLQIFEQRVDTFRDDAASDTYHNFQKIDQLLTEQKEESKTFQTKVLSDMERLTSSIEALRLEHADQSGVVKTMETLRLDVANEIDS
jgi:hypothetical protein